MRRLLSASLIIIAAWGLGGCAGYQLGEATTLPFDTVQIAPPVNASLAPQAAALLGTQVAREIDRTGLARVAPPGTDAGDARLEIVITKLDREVSADRADDVGLARKWRLTLTATCTLTDRRNGRVYFHDRVVSAFDEIYTDSGTNPAEYQNMPVLTARLAERIAREVVAVW